MENTVTYFYEPRCILSEGHALAEWIADVVVVVVVRWWSPECLFNRRSSVLLHVHTMVNNWRSKMACMQQSKQWLNTISFYAPIGPTYINYQSARSTNMTYRSSVLIAGVGQDTPDDDDDERSLRWCRHGEIDVPTSLNHRRQQTNTADYVCVCVQTRATRKEGI